MSRLEKDLKSMELKMRWAKNKPTLRELRKKKTVGSKMYQILEKTAFELEHFEYETFVSKHKVPRKIHEFFFGEIEHESTDEFNTSDEVLTTQEYNTTKEGNVVHVNFNK
ncbi:hypothetical protein ABFV99_14105 [Cytobacillus horneckiae]|uniref:hypothetical protein n=1 Tax=Cytobacillus horneckiae TaxID=549687 RepID=UPI0034CD9F41